MAIFDFGGAFQKAFGYSAPETDASKINLPAAPKRLETSKKGQVYYATDLFGREFFLPVFLNGYLLPFAVISMKWKKTIVSTALPERGGTVNELVSIDDYAFNIKGILVNEDDNFPEEQITDLHEIFKINASVTLRSVLTDLVLTGQSDANKSDPEGHKVIIREVSWPTVTGIEHAKPFEIELTSDMIFDLELA
jgi:hypothetical protein